MIVFYCFCKWGIEKCFFGIKVCVEGIVGYFGFVYDFFNWDFVKIIMGK